MYTILFMTHAQKDAKMVGKIGLKVNQQTEHNIHKFSYKLNFNQIHH